MGTALSERQRPLLLEPALTLLPRVISTPTEMWTLWSPPPVQTASFFCPAMEMGHSSRKDPSLWEPAPSLSQRGISMEMESWISRSPTKGPTTFRFYLAMEMARSLRYPRLPWERILPQ